MPTYRTKKLSEEEFKQMLLNKEIRPATLDDVTGTHHKRPLYKHPRTKQFFTTVKDRAKLKG